MVVHSFGPIGRLVVPFKGLQSISFHGSECVDEMTAQLHRNVLRPKPPRRWSVLRPIRVVTNATIGVALRPYNCIMVAMAMYMYIV